MEAEEDGVGRGEHQRWEEGVLPQHVAQAGFALDGGTLGGQGGDVAVEGSQRDAELVGEHGAGDRAAAQA